MSGSGISANLSTFPLQVLRHPYPAECWRPPRNGPGAQEQQPMALVPFLLLPAGRRTAERLVGVDQVMA